jgi:hypothetical protein
MSLLLDFYKVADPGATAAKLAQPEHAAVFAQLVAEHYAELRDSGGVPFPLPALDPEAAMGRGCGHPPTDAGAFFALCVIFGVQHLPYTISYY